MAQTVLRPFAGERRSKTSNDLAQMIGSASILLHRFGIEIVPFYI